MGEEFGGSDKLALAPKGSAEPLGVRRTFLQQALNYVKRYLQNLPYRTPKVPQNAGEPLGARTRLLRTRLFFGQKLRGSFYRG